MAFVTSLLILLGSAGYPITNFGFTDERVLTMLIGGNVGGSYYYKVY